MLHRTRFPARLVALFVSLLVWVLPSSSSGEGCEQFGISFRTIGSANGPGSWTVVARSGDLAIVGGHVPTSDGLQVFDFSDPTDPILLGTIEAAGGPLDLSIEAELVLAALGSKGITIVEFSDPSLPTTLANLILPGSPIPSVTGVALALPYAYATNDRSNRFHVLDLSDPSAPSQITSIPLPGTPHRLAVSGGYAYVACGVGTGSPDLVIVDISIPASPSIVGSFNAAHPAYDLAVSGNLVYLMETNDESTNLDVVDVSAPASPVSIGSVTVTDADNARDIALSGNRVYFACINSGLWAVDVADPAEPIVTGTLAVEGLANGVAASGDEAIVIGSAMHVIDVASPNSPPVLGSVDTPGAAWAVAAAWPFAFVADGTSGLQVIDISIPTAPALVHTVGTGGSAAGVVLVGDLAYVANGGTMKVIDIADPLAAAVIGSCAVPGSANGIDVRGTHAYIASGSPGLTVVDVSIPSAPVVTGTANLGDIEFWSRRVTVSGTHAYVLTDPSVPDWYGPTLEVFEVTDPGNPLRIGNASGGGWAGAVHASEDRCFVARSNRHTNISGQGDFGILDLTQPISPQQVASVTTQHCAMDVAVRDEVAYVATGLAGLQAFDLSDESAPKVLACIPTTGFASGVALAGEYVVLVTGPTGGLQILPADCVMATGLPAAGVPAARDPLLTAWPTPSRGGVNFTIRVPGESAFDLSIHDVTGRTVRRLPAGTARAGDNTIAWDGRDEDGDALPSGHYLARLEWAKGSTTRRVTLLR